MEFDRLRTLRIPDKPNLVPVEQEVRSVMYVCVCNAINCRSVRQAAREGATSVAAVFKALGKAPQCGACFTCMRETIAEVSPVPPPSMAVAAE